MRLDDDFDGYYLVWYYIGIDLKPCPLNAYLKNRERLFISQQFRVADLRIDCDYTDGLLPH